MASLTKGFIENIDKSPFSLYSDTDSSYMKIPLPFSKTKDTHKTVGYIQTLAKEMNTNFTDIFNDTVVKYGNVNPKYNLMDFKSEVVAYRGFFNAKKYYGLAKMWDEGTFFDDPKVKKTGGQIVKADSTQITLDLLNEIYHVLLLDFEITDEIQLYQKIFIKIREKYLKRTNTAVKNLDFHEFGIPKKWGIRELKTVPKQVLGAKLYNYLFQNNIRSGDSVLQCQIITNPNLLLQHWANNKPNSKYQIDQKDINQKLNVISFPSDISKDQVDRIKPVFDQFNIRFDLRNILDFNVNMKLDQFQKLFSKETQRLAI